MSSNLENAFKVKERNTPEINAIDIPKIIVKKRKLSQFKQNLSQLHTRSNFKEDNNPYGIEHSSVIFSFLFQLH